MVFPVLDLLVVDQAFGKEKLFWQEVVEYSSFWKLNGSIIGLKQSGSHRKFVYLLPRESLKKYGIVKGSIWFEGTNSGDTYRGVLSVFRGGCRPATYQAIGDLAGEEENSSLSISFDGIAPMRSGTCVETSKRKVTDVLSFYKKRLGYEDAMPSYDRTLSVTLNSTERAICANRKLAEFDSTSTDLLSKKK